MQEIRNNGFWFRLSGTGAVFYFCDGSWVFDFYAEVGMRAIKRNTYDTMYIS